MENNLKQVTLDKAIQIVETADVFALAATLACLNGQESVLNPNFRPDQNRLLEPDAGLDFDQLVEARQYLAKELLAYLNNGTSEVLPQDSGMISSAIAFLTGGENLSSYVPLFMEELGLGSEDLRAPNWKLEEVSPGRKFRVAVIGAGMSGIVAGYRLRQCGIDVTIYEKNAQVGGTWLENSYPGCRVDVPSHLYAYSFFQRSDWPDHFSSQPVLEKYFVEVANTTGVTEVVKFNSEIKSIIFDDTLNKWKLEIVKQSGADGEVESPENCLYDGVISAVGQLNRPFIPLIEGQSSFLGSSFHSANWNGEISLENKRVAVVGTGASAAQIVPSIASQVSNLYVFQRTPNWLAPTPNYRSPVEDGMHLLLKQLPTYAQWYRFWLFWKNCEGMLPLVQVDENWPNQEKSVSMLNDFLREILTIYLTSEFEGREDLLSQVIPDYPPSAKRVIRDDGSWAQALKRPNVELVCQNIDQIARNGIRLIDGRLVEVDVIIYATGFQASNFLTPMKVIGRNGRDLHTWWNGDAQAYLGVSIPKFPNFFMLYGPNTNIVINGSIIYFSECGTNYILDCIKYLLDNSLGALSVKEQVCKEFNREIDVANQKMAWGASSVNSWYKNSKGRVSQNWPYTLHEYWKRTSNLSPEDFDFFER